MVKKSCLLSAVALLGLFAASCSNDSTSSNGTYLRVSFKDTAPLPSPGSGPSPVPSAVSSVTLTQARVVIGRIEFRGAGGDTAKFRSAEHSPLVVNLNLTGVNHSIGTAAVPAGTYNNSLFRIEKLQTSDSAVYNANPDLRDLSILVEGYVNGAPESTFVFSSTLDEEQQRDLTPFTVSAGTTTNIEFQFDHRQWFDDGAGGQIDPREAQLTSSRSTVETNIKNSFDLFKP